MHLSFDRMKDFQNNIRLTIRPGTISGTTIKLPHDIETNNVDGK